MKAKQMTPEDKAKWQKIFAEHDAKTAHTMGALREFAHHFVENENLIETDAENEVQKNLPKWKPANDDEISEYLWERGQPRELHDETLFPMHRYSCIVMLYIVVERELKRLVSNLETIKGRKIKLQDGGDYIQKVQNTLKLNCGLDISLCKVYTTLHDLRKVRNCIIHNQGELPLCNEKEQKYFDGLKKKYKHLFAHPMSDIKVSREAIDKMLRDTLAFFIWVFEQLQKLQPVEKLNWNIKPGDELQRMEKILAKIK